MNKYLDLYDFIDFAKGNRKYPENTANGLKSALKIFEKELNIDELASLDLVEDNIEEIFVSVVGKNKDKSIGSLNTYKARVLKVIKDYQRYGANPSKIQGWNTKINKPAEQKHIRPQTLPIHSVDTADRNQDKTQIALSEHINTPVHKIELSLRDNMKSVIIVPKDISAKEVQMFKNMLDSLVVDD
jgi:site-specific recombinase XerD